MPRVFGTDFDSEPKLVEAAQKELDGSEFTHLYEVYFPRLTWFFIHRGFSNGDAEDLAQDVLIKVHAALPKYIYEPEKFTSWIYQIASNHLKNEWRKSGRRGHVEYVDSESAFFTLLSDNPDTTDPARIILNKENFQLHVRHIKNVLESFPSKHRTIFFLSVLREFQNQKVAEHFGSTEGAIKTLLSRVRQKLRKQTLGEDEEVR